jgi:hypothetical protein
MRIPACTLLFLLVALPCAAQQSSQSSDSDQSSSQSQTQNQDKSQSTDKSQSAQSPSTGKRRSAAEENPFPEDTSEKAAAAAGNPSSDAPAPKPGAGADKAPGSSGNSKTTEPQPNYSSSRTGLRDLDSANSDESRISDGTGGYIFDPKLAAQDVKVGNFYLTNGDYKGAYSRFKEATKVDPGNADAVFGVAEAARELKFDKEAADNYRVYLDAMPDGSKAKAARKALARLGEPDKK